MKIIKTFENSERLVKLLYNEFDKKYTVILLTRDRKCKDEIYKSLYWAERKFNDYKSYPLKEMGVK